MRVGVFGGTFDPVHYGHLILAEQCREQGRLDEILFVPAPDRRTSRDPSPVLNNALKCSPSPSPEIRLSASKK